MADFVIFASSGRDGVVESNLGINFATARGSSTTTGGAVDTSSTNDLVGIVYTSGGRGGYRIHRGFFMFDCSDTEIGGHFAGTPEIAHAEIRVTEYASPTGAGGFSILKVVDLGSGLGTEDYPKIFSSGTTIAGEYTDLKIDIDGSYHIMNSLARRNIETAIDEETYFQCALVSDLDRSASDPAPGSNNQRVIFANNALNKPALRLTFGTSGIWNGINF